MPTSQNFKCPALNLEEYRVTKPDQPVLDLEQYKVSVSAEPRADLDEYIEYKSNELRFKTQEELLEFSKHNFVFYRDDFGMYLQQKIETEDQFINFLQRCCMFDYQISDNPWLMWIVNDSSVMEEYLEPTEQLIQRREASAESDCVEDCWLVDGEAQYGPDQLIEAWQADYNQFFDEPFEVHKTKTKVFLPGDLRVTDRYKSQMPFLARFVSHNTWDRCGSIKGQNLAVIPLESLYNDVISIY